MAAADCPICEAMGYRSCDQCGTPIFKPSRMPGAELCGYCKPQPPRKGRQTSKKPPRSRRPSISVAVGVVDR